MSLFTTYFGLDMKNPVLFTGGEIVTTSTADKYVITEGDYKIVYRGTFTYDEFDNPSGALISMRVYDNGVLQQKALDLDLTIETVLAASDIDSFTKLLMSGSDTMNGSDLKDSLYGYDGDDVMYGNDGNDVLKGHDGNDIIDGGSGNDKISGGKGTDILSGGNGRDYIIGDNGDDVISGGKKADVLAGGRGNDTLDGGLGDDILLGSDVGNKLYDFGGNDIMTGGGGADVFYFIKDAGGDHIVTDFTADEDFLYVFNYGITTLKQLKQQSTMVDGDTVFDFGNGNTITLENFGKSDLSNEYVFYYDLE